MGNNHVYPKVLIVHSNCINEYDQHGVSIRGWFGDWPKDNLAQIYSGFEHGDARFCGRNYKLDTDDRKFSKFFFKIKRSSLGRSSYSIALNKESRQLKEVSNRSLYKNKIINWLISTGIWEIIFRPVISDDMLGFVEDFKPEIIYCQGYTLTFTWLPVMLQNRFNIPICFQTGDDWPAYLYRFSPFQLFIRPIVKKAVKVLLLRASLRLSNGNLMTKVYQRRYGVSFEPLMMCDNINRFSEAAPHFRSEKADISIVYSGNLGHGRWDSILELSEAAAKLQIEKDYKIKITVLATIIPPQIVNQLKDRKNLQIIPGPSHEDLPSYLKDADILFLPETFDPLKVREIKLSISTKAHFYMMSKKPILVYAHPEAGVAHYANEEKWAYVVMEQDLDKLAQALLELITDVEYAKRLVNTGIEVVLKNHSESEIRARFLSRLIEINPKKGF